MAGFDKIEQILNIKVTGASEISRMNKEIERLSSSQKKLRKSGKQGTAQFAEQKVKLKGLRSEYNKSAKELNRLATGQKKASSFTGKLTKSFGLAALGAAAAMKAMQLLSSSIANGIKTFVGFEFAMAKVKAVTGATQEEFEQLKSSAMNLGRTTFFTASQVAQLQLNLSKLGFTTTEVLQSQEAILQLSTAMGEDLGRTATVVASTVRGFSLDASEAGRVADVMARAFSSSALDLEKFQTSMSKVSSIAEMAGFSLEDTTALLGTLTDRGIEASIAGTSLRNILLKLQDPTSDLSKRLGRTVHSGEDLVIALKELKNSGIDVAGVMGIVDQRQVMAMNSFINSSFAIEDFTEQLNNASGAGRGMSDIMENTVQGSIFKVKSAWEGLTLTIMNGGGRIKVVIDAMSTIFNDLADRWSTSEMLSTQVIASANKQVKTLLDDQTQFLKDKSEEDKELYTKKYSDIMKIALEEMEREGKHLDKKATEMESVNKFLETEWHASDRKLARKRAEAQTLAIAEFKMMINERVKSEEDAVAREEELAAEKAKRDALELALSKDQLVIQEQLLENAKAVIAVNDKQRIKKNQDIAAIEKEIKRLKELGIEKEKQEKPIEDSTALQDLLLSILNEEQFIKQQFIDGEIKSKADLNQKLRKMQIEQMEWAIKHAGLEGDALMEVERRLLDAKTNLMNQAADAKGKSLDLTNQEEVKALVLASDNAQDFAQKVISIKTAEATSGLIASIFKSVPNPFIAAILAAGAQSLIMGIMQKSTARLLGGGGEKFANGGLTNGGMFQGASHANGGVKFAVGGRIHEAEGGEAIINKRSTSMFKPLLSAINSHNNYGKKFAMGGVTGGIQSKYAIGGMTASSLGDIVSGGGMGGSQTVMVVESDITKTQSRVSAIEAQASF